MPSTTLRIGFIPLVDCALLAIAQERHFFAANGLCVELRKAQSWGAIRDNLTSGDVDAAHLLITMPLQSALAADAKARALCYAFTLSRNGNGIILSNALWKEGVRDAAGLSSWMAARPESPVRLGVVFPRGTQEYFLRSWLAKGGLGLDGRVSLTIIPPQEMVGRLRKGEIDGFCVGEPWTRRATASKLGRLVADSAGLLPGLGEKVLGVRAAWHREHAKEHGQVIRALSQASAWLADPGNLEVAVEILSSKRYVNTPKSVVEAALKDAALRGLPGGLPEGDGANSRFSGGDPNRPARSHSQWYLEQMLRHGHVDVLSATRLEVTSVCLEGFYLEALSGFVQSPAAPATIGLPATFASGFPSASAA